MRRLAAAIRKAARSDRPVLVQGPTGAGKELVARAVHQLGANASAPLVDVNCAAIPEPLMEGQIFGWERGAFTGADRAHEGILAAAQRGTCLLDEIGEMPLRLQAKLLRVLETRRFRPLGGAAERAFHGRIVAATHVDIESRARTGEFRADLYYRLGVLLLRVPPLCERREDIPELVHHFARMQDRPLVFRDEALDFLTEAPWPGNVRQLRNAIDRLAVFAEESAITVGAIREVLDDGLEAGPSGAGGMRDLARLVIASEAPNKLQAVEQVLVDEALDQAGGNRCGAARLLGVDRKVVERRIAARRRVRTEAP